MAATAPLSSADLLLACDPDDDESILAVASDATLDAVRRAYRALALAVHPDRCGHTEATRAFQLLQAAFQRRCDIAGAARNSAAGPYSHAADDDVDEPSATPSCGRAKRPAVQKRATARPAAKRRQKGRGSPADSDSEVDVAPPPRVAPPLRRSAAAAARESALKRGRLEAGSDDDQFDDSGSDAGQPTRKAAAAEPEGDWCDQNGWCHTCGDGGLLLLCDGCPNSVHLECVWPPMREVDLPQGDWFCHQCMLNGTDTTSVGGSEVAAHAAKAEPGAAIAATAATARQPVALAAGSEGVGVDSDDDSLLDLVG
ncbi:hypothetical protein T492DRAFT_984022 [Pavlovales sp. CCMP2436]|nr:hypothetical protein T492DRAFT_984022 [Pavlovales sp. CCMP2436]